jgi:hypothetical protein
MLLLNFCNHEFNPPIPSNVSWIKGAKEMTKLRVQAQFDDEPTDLTSDNEATLKELMNAAQQLATGITDLQESLMEDPKTKQVAVNLQGQTETLLEEALRDVGDAFRALSEFERVWRDTYV